MVNIMVSLCFS